MTEEQSKITEKIAKEKGLTESEVKQAMEFMEEVMQAVKEALETIVETVLNILDEIFSKREEMQPVPNMPIPPMDTSKASQVTNNKPMLPRIRNNI
ncbi:hypothetical protein ACDX78_13545 [Virgibacillus oceani]